MPDSPQELLELLIHESDEERCRAIARELVERCDGALAGQLLRLLNSYPGPVAEAAAFLLAERSTGGFVSAGAVPDAIAGFSHASPEVRQWCATILRGIGADARAAVEPLLNALNDPDAGVRQAVEIGRAHV